MMNEHELIDLIYEASTSPHLWSDVIQNIVEMSNSKTAIFTALDQMCQDYDFIYTHNIPQESLAAYQEEKIKQIDMQIHVPLLLNAGIGNPYQEDFTYYADQPETDQYIFFEKCMKPTGIGILCGLLLEQGAHKWAILGIHRAVEAGLYQNEELEFFQRIAKHLRRALQIHRQISLVQAENNNLQLILNKIKTGVLLLNEECCLNYSNEQARKIFEKYNLLSLDRFNRIILPAKFQAKFDELILNTVSINQNHEIGGVMSISHENEQAIMISVVPFSHSSSRFNPLQQHNKCIAVFLTEVDRAHTLSTSFLKQEFSLVKREIEICEYFVNGYDFEEISQVLNITLETVRTYFKRIYQKTGCTSQANLIHTLMGMTINFEHIC